MPSDKEKDDKKKDGKKKTKEDDKKRPKPSQADSSGSATSPKKEK